MADVNMFLRERAIHICTLSQRRRGIIDDGKGTQSTLHVSVDDGISLKFENIHIKQHQGVTIRSLLSFYECLGIYPAILDCFPFCIRNHIKAYFQPISWPTQVKILQ